MYSLETLVNDEFTDSGECKRPSCSTTSPPKAKHFALSFP